MTADRLLLIGIDGATPDLIRPWSERGDLPTLARVMRSGSAGPLVSVPNMITPAAWTSFATGCSPGRHGIFFFTERVPGSYDERFIKGGGRAVPPFWMLLGAQGLRTAVVNVPMTFPADPVNGIMVSGMDAPGMEAPGFTHPPGLVDELRSRFGHLLAARSLSGAIGHLMLAGKLDAAREILERRVRDRTELARFLIDRYPVDLFALVHTEVDGAQHYFWRYLDSRVPGTSPREVQRYGDTILRLYQSVDRSVESLLSTFGTANVMVLSDHGAGVSPGVEDGVPWIRLVLEEMGLAARRDEGRGVRRASSGALAALYRMVNPRLPSPMRRTLRRLVPGVKAAAKASVQYRYDWARTRAFCMGAAGDVWLNVRGRDPEGLVEPGPDYERVRGLIRETFLALREAETSEPVVEVVDFREEVHDGPFLDRAPDLFIRFRDVVISGLVMDGRVLRLPARAAAAPKEIKSGSHRPEGVLALSGAGVRPGGTLTGARLIDAAPTILYWLGAPVPSYMDGRVLTDAFTEETLRLRPPQRVERSIEPGGEPDAGYSSEDAAVVSERLRDLGYV